MIVHLPRARCLDPRHQRSGKQQRQAERALLIKEVGAMPDRSSTKPIMIYLSPQSVDGSNNPLREAILSAAKKGTLSGINMDEMHRYGTDRAFRDEMSALKENIFDHLADDASMDISIIAMTATLWLGLCHVVPPRRRWRHRVHGHIKVGLLPWGTSTHRLILIGWGRFAAVLNL